jgi:prepilin-type N-terminal cleavage/methylation domain-containing protein
MRRNQGFTLIELMIVIAIIAIIAAIAIPGLLASQRASNERNASASLKTVTAAEADFRGNDRDGNKVRDFWTRDLSGLYSLCPTGVAEPIKLIELSVALGDTLPLGVGVTAAGTEPAIANFGLQSAKASYWYRVFLQDETGAAYANITNGQAPWAALAAFHTEKFGFYAFPDSRAMGRNIFVINESNTIYKRGVTSTYVRPGTGAVPNGVIPVAQLTGPAATPSTQWPTDAQLASDFSKLD